MTSSFDPLFGARNSSLLLLLLLLLAVFVCLNPPTCREGLLRWLWRTYTTFPLSFLPKPGPYRVRLVDFLFSFYFGRALGCSIYPKNRRCGKRPVFRANKAITKKL
ncbi:hypothetical protein V8C35DRAFT_251210 [Trichoderma chlorosporum]